MYKYEEKGHQIKLKVILRRFNAIERIRPLKARYTKPRGIQNLVPQGTL